MAIRNKVCCNKGKGATSKEHLFDLSVPLVVYLGVGPGGTSCGQGSFCPLVRPSGSGEDWQACLGGPQRPAFAASPGKDRHHLAPAPYQRKAPKASQDPSRTAAVNESAPFLGKSRAHHHLCRDHAPVCPSLTGSLTCLGLRLVVTTRARSHSTSLFPDPTLLVAPRVH